MQRRDILKGFIGGAMVAVAPKTPAILLPEEKQLIVDVVEVKQTLERQAPFRITSWSIESEQNLTFTPGFAPASGRLSEVLTVNFELLDKDDISKYEQAVYDCHFVWDLPAYNCVTGGWDATTVKGSIMESRIEQEVGEMMRGSLKAIVLYYDGPKA